MMGACVDGKGLATTIRSCSGCLDLPSSLGISVARNPRPIRRLNVWEQVDFMYAVYDFPFSCFYYSYVCVSIGWVFDPIPGH